MMSKMRTGVYIRNGINYIRQNELEGLNNGLVIIDVQLQTPVQIICLYRIFNPPGNFTQHSYFTSQLQLIKVAAERRGHKKLIILGDFNLNEAMKYNNDYSHKSYYDEIISVFYPMGLVQLVEFETRRRIVNGILRTLILDHVYTDDVTLIEELSPVETIIGNHSLVTLSLRNVFREPPIISFRRNWSKYLKEKLLHELSRCEMNWEISARYMLSCKIFNFV